MADSETPVKMEDDVTAKTEEASVPRVVLKDVEGEVLKAKRFGIYISFKHEGKSQVAVMFPGRAYVNASSLLLDVCKTDQELSLLMPKGTKIHANVESLSSSLMYQEDGDVPAHPTQPGTRKRYGHGWHISLLWLGPKIEHEVFTDINVSLDSFNESFDKRLELVGKNCLQLGKPSITLPSSDSDSWFLCSIKMPKTGSALPHPDNAQHKSVSAVVTKVLRPHGGVAQVDGSKIEVFFHRSRVFINGDHLSATVDLSKIVKVGTKITMDYNADSDLFNTGCDANAAVAYTGDSRPEISEVLFKANEKDKFFIAKIVSFDPPCEDGTGVASGVAEIVRPTEKSSLAFDKKLFTRLLDNDSTVKRVRFHRKNMLFLGSHLINADLRYFFSESSFGLDIFYCFVKPLETPTGSDPNLITHEATLGWKSSTKFLHSTGQGSLALSANKMDDSVLYPRLHSFLSVKYMSKEGFDAETFENILEGQLPPRSEYFNDNDVEGYAFARVYDLYPAVANGVNACIVQIETGEHAGQKAFVDRSVSSAFGWKLNKADLQHLVDLHEPVFLKLAKTDAKGHNIKLKATEMWMGWPLSVAAAKAKKSVDHLPEDKRYKLFLYMETHGMATIEDFLKCVNGEKVPKQFLPFRKEENKGTIIHLDPPPPQKNMGAVSGIIKVDRGPLTGKLIHFHRRNTWVLGHNMGKADLTHIFIEGQKVSVEAISCAGEEKKSNKPKEHDFQHRATLVWTSKFRPRNDIEKTVPESVHVNNWLKKRNLTWDKFHLLVKGQLPVVDRQIATRHKSNMLKGNEIANLDTIAANAAGSPAAAPRMDAMPVFRHGAEAARICDLALSINGPNDPRIGQLIRNNENAQMAFHIHKALEMSLEAYKKNTGRVAIAGDHLSGTNRMNEGVFTQPMAPQIQGQLPAPVPLMGPNPFLNEGPQQRQAAGGGGNWQNTVARVTRKRPASNAPAAARGYPAGGPASAKRGRGMAHQKGAPRQGNNFNKKNNKTGGKSNGKAQRGRGRR